MTQSFQPTPDTDKHPDNLNAMPDFEPMHSDEIHYPEAQPLPDYAHGTQGTDHASVTQSPTKEESIFTEHPGEFFTRRVPIMPTVGRTLTRTVNVFGDGVHRPLIGRNRNRKRLVLRADPANAGPIFVACRDQDSGVALYNSNSAIPYEFFTFYEFTVWSAANGLLYLVEEDYYVNSDGQ